MAEAIGPAVLNRSASVRGCGTVLSAAFAREPGLRWICGDATVRRERWFAATLAAHDTLPGARRLTLDRGGVPIAAIVLTPPGGTPPARAKARWVTGTGLGCGPGALVRTLRYAHGAETATPQGAWTLEFLGVVPEHRGLGAARRLLDHVVSELPAPGGIFLTTADPENERLYRRFGFTTRQHLVLGPLTTAAMWRPGATA
ncbi:GNAT family N-acetyltransferase [Streptomyces sp. NPDC049906]|uniref:GNAT family N-acetyltransferase n=1 Tax=Streptomyces sp. NPDC049906 TaxID=3155656 RepID=UPI00342A106C